MTHLTEGRKPICESIASEGIVRNGSLIASFIHINDIWGSRNFKFPATVEAFSGPKYAIKRHANFNRNSLSLLACYKQKKREA